MSRNQDREDAFKAYMSGNSCQAICNPKGEYELHSPDGLNLYFLDYHAIKKTDMKMNGKPIILINRFNYVPFNEHGNPATQTIVRLLDLVYNMMENKSFAAYHVVYVAIGKDIDTVDLQAYSQEITQSIYNLISVNNWGFEWRRKRFFSVWGKEGFIVKAKQALALVKHLDGNTGITCEYESLQEISKNVKRRWAILNTIVNYWLLNGLKFSADDDAYIGKATIPVRSAYNALGGKRSMIKKPKKEAGILFIRLLNPTTPLDELPLYMDVEDEYIKDKIKERLTRGA